MVYIDIYIIYTYSFILCYTGPFDTSLVTEGITPCKFWLLLMIIIIIIIITIIIIIIKSVLFKKKSSKHT